MTGVTVDHICAEPTEVLQFRLETLPRRRYAAVFQAVVKS
jgi:hypothetical protein